jgi:hypothetical protein
VFVRLWQQLKLDELCQPRLGESREGTDWHQVLMVLVAYRLIDPGSEWRLHREWFEHRHSGGFPAHLRGARRQHRGCNDVTQFLERIERLYGKARRIWVMDRCIPTEAHLALMRERGAQ